MSRVVGPSPTNRGHVPDIKVPAVSATMKSRIPSRFQKTKARVAARVGSRTIADATNGALIPIAASPRPAGYAKNLGSKPSQQSCRNMSPKTRHDCMTARSRTSSVSTKSLNRGAARYRTRKIASGASTAAGNASVNSPGVDLNTPACERVAAKMAHIAIAAATRIEHPTVKLLRCWIACNRHFRLQAGSPRDRR